MFPIHTAPAVWLLEGPTITGPKMSKISVNGLSSVRIECQPDMAAHQVQSDLLYQYRLLFSRHWKKFSDLFFCAFC